jgi:hypothetical protein
LIDHIANKDAVMRKLLTFLLVALLAGCASQPRTVSEAKAKAPEEPRFKVPITSEQEMAATAAVAAMLKDPESARFQGIYGMQWAGHPEVTSICGEVNAKNSYGGYAGFSRFLVAGSLVELWDRNPKYGYSVGNSMITLICTPTTSGPASPDRVSAPATPAAHGSVSGQSKDQQLRELSQQNLPYEEYQKRYRQIMGE